MYKWIKIAFWLIVLLGDVIVLAAIIGPPSVQKWFINAICSALQM